MLVNNIVLKSGIKEVVVVDGLRAELFAYPRTEKDKPLEIIEINLTKELMMWTCFCYDGKSSVQQCFSWELEKEEKADVKEALFQIYELI